jgi:catechol 1,2-dioxygenase
VTGAARDHAARKLADDVVQSFSNCTDERLRSLMQGLVRHLHAFVREAGLTLDEWERGMAVLKETASFTSEDRHEFILWSDALGISMAVDTLNERDARTTESTVEGPFWAPGAPERQCGDSIAERPGGTPLLMTGRIVDLDGSPIPGATIDVWQNSPDGLYAVQDPEAPPHHLRGRFRTGADGAYAFLGVRPTPYEIPGDGPVGAMLRAAGRHAWRPAHIHVAVSAPGFQTVVTHIFDESSDFLDSDAVFAVKPSLVKRFVPRDADDPERPRGVAEPWCSAEVDFVLGPAADATDAT